MPSRNGIVNSRAPRSTRWGSALAFALTFATTCAAQVATSQIFRHRVARWEHLGHAVLALGDLNNDGHAEYAVGAPPHVNNTGKVYFVDGRTGCFYRTIQGFGGHDRFGKFMLRIHDVDGDKVRDMLIAAPLWASGANAVGRVGVFSVKTGKILATMQGTQHHEFFGRSLAVVGDANKDGVPDYVIGSEGYASQWGRVQIFSGKDFKTVLATYSGTGTGDYFGTGVAGVGDLDKDGYDDLMVTSATYAKCFSSQRRILLKTITGVSGVVANVGDLDGDQRDDVVVRQRQSTLVALSLADYKNPKSLYAVSAWPYSVAKLDDLDGDGVPEFGVGNPYDGSYRHGRVTIFSGKLGRVFTTVLGRDDAGRVGSGRGEMGWGMATADVDADGKTDLIVGQPGTALNGKPVDQAVYVLAFKSRTLVADDHKISLASGGAVNFTIHAGLKNAGKLYFGVGSVTGYRPGFSAWGHHFPLNPDPYFDIVLNFPNGPILSNSLGFLDNNGNGTFTLKIIPGLSNSNIGRTVDHAAAVLCDRTDPCFIKLVTTHCPVTMAR